MENENNAMISKFNLFMGKISSNSILKAITSGMIAIMPLTLGTFLIAIIVSLPIEGWQLWINETGIINDMQAVAGGTTEILSIFLVICISYQYAKIKDLNGLSASVMSLGFFLILIPQKIIGTDGTTINAFSKDYIGSMGIFVALLTAILVSVLYSWLTKKGLVIKLPESVPTYVSEAFSPAFISIIIFSLAFVIRVLFRLTTYDNIFNFTQEIITAPIMGIGSSTVAVIGLSVLANFVWFFGIHPGTLISATMPIFMTSLAGNIEAFQKGEALPYVVYAVLTFGFLTIGGQGGTIGLAINLILFSKSERYKALGKLSIVPSIFNINEPLIFGTPIILNPIYFIPMILSSVVSGSIGLIFIKFGLFNKFNPLIMLPNVMPSPLTIFASSGILAALAVFVAIAALVALYYPFFKYGDKRALAEESELIQEFE